MQAQNTRVPHDSRANYLSVKTWDGSALNKSLNNEDLLEAYRYRTARYESCEGVYRTARYESSKGVYRTARYDLQPEEQPGTLVKIVRGCVSK